MFTSFGLPRLMFHKRALHTSVLLMACCPDQNTCCTKLQNIHLHLVRPRRNSTSTMIARDVQQQTKFAGFHKKWDMGT